MNSKSKYFAVIKEYNGSNVIASERNAIEAAQGSIASQYGGQIDYHMTTEGECTRGDITFCFHKDVSNPSAVALEIDMTAWKKENYVFFPAAVYNGNRFRTAKIAYPPFLKVDKEEALSVPTTITDVPRLSNTASKSSIQLLSGDVSTPAMGYYDQTEKRGFIILCEHKTEFGYTGIFIEEDLEKSKATLSISAPGVREQTQYRMATNEVVSDDEGVLFRKGEKVKLSFCSYYFEAETLQQFYDKFYEVRYELERGNYSNVLPFSKAYESIKQKMQQDNYSARENFYGLGFREGEQFWQAGWVGGGINSYPFLIEEDGLAYGRAIKSLKFIFNHLQTPNGWIAPMYWKDNFYGDTLNFFKGIAEDDTAQNTLLLRKNSDLLYFVMKQLVVLKKQNKQDHPLDIKVKKLCEAYMGLWEKYGQLGQFIHMANNEIIIGNTASAAITPAALVLAYEYFGDEKYLKVAEEIGEYYYEKNLSIGLLNGGPGEILQCPDSESSFGLLESYVALYEATEKPKWLMYAEQTAKQAATWVMSYDFEFPAQSTLGKMKMHTIGTVFANVQNKHSAPGICTLSGNSLLKLYRFTGERSYLELLKGISHNLMQFVQTEERPLMTLDGKSYPAGYMGERVQTSDWEGKSAIGEIAGGSSAWPEAAALLTYIEVPGIYINFKDDTIMVLDHIQYSVLEHDEMKICIGLTNDTQFDAKVTLLIDGNTSLEKLGTHYFDKMRTISIKAGESEVIELKK